MHLKTAGTSYLEAIRVIAKRDAALFREIMQFAIDRYETDKASYHVSAELSKVAKLSAVPDDQLVSYLDDFHARQVLHVTFGSVLTTKKPDGSYLFRDRLYTDLKIVRGGLRTTSSASTWASTSGRLRRSRSDFVKENTNAGPQVDWPAASFTLVASWLHCCGFGPPAVPREITGCNPIDRRWLRWRTRIWKNSLASRARQR